MLPPPTRPTSEPSERCSCDSSDTSPAFDLTLLLQQEDERLDNLYKGLIELASLPLSCYEP